MGELEDKIAVGAVKRLIRAAKEIAAVNKEDAIEAFERNLPGQRRGPETARQVMQQRRRVLVMEVKSA